MKNKVLLEFDYYLYKKRYNLEIVSVILNKINIAWKWYKYYLC